MGDDPVQHGFVASLARPGGNTTGLTVSAGPELDAKRLEILHQALPGAARIAILATPWYEPYTKEALAQLETAAKALGVRLSRIEVRKPEDIEPAVATAQRAGAQALLVLISPLTLAHAARIGELAERHRIPAMTHQDLVTAGYALSYGPSWARVSRRVGYYLDKVLRGTKPADLPVEQPTTFDLIINLKTAKALGLTIPPAMLLRADRVLE